MHALSLDIDRILEQKQCFRNKIMEVYCSEMKVAEAATRAYARNRRKKKTFLNNNYTDYRFSLRTGINGLCLALCRITARNSVILIERRTRPSV